MPGCEEPEILTGYFHASQGVEERFQTMPDETALYPELMVSVAANVVRCVVELRPQYLPRKISVAERAIATRLRNGTHTGSDECDTLPESTSETA
jgi:hypothetical protein